MNTTRITVPKYPDEVKFCVKYLNSKGYKSTDFSSILQSTSAEDPDFNLVKKQTEQFFIDLASALRPMWPPGDKEGKWAWRESVDNLSRRLQALWRLRKLPEYPLEVCVSVASRYLESFNDKSTKYMQTLKYFVLKQDTVHKGNGKVELINKSKFADMLEGKSDDDAIQNEWEELIGNTNLGEGELI